MAGRRTLSAVLARLLSVMLLGVGAAHGVAQSQFARDRDATLGPPKAQVLPAQFSTAEGQPVPPAAAPLPPPRPVTAGPLPAVPTLFDLTNLSLERHPVLQQAVVDIDAAQGRAYQAGLYPNPVFTFSGDEISDRTGPGGILTAQLNQEIVTGHKLRLSRAAAQRDVDLATLALVRQRYTLLTTVRQGYFEVLAAQRRVGVLTRLVALVAAADEQAGILLSVKQIAPLDRSLFQIELDRLRAELAAARRERDAAWRRLAARMGIQDLPATDIADILDADLPDYRFDPARAYVLEVHPEVRSAQVGVTRAQLALQRARAEPIPNVTVGTGYTRQNQNRSNDWLLQVSLPVPVFNRNQGNIAAAQADVGRAGLEVGRVQYDLSNRLAAAFGQYHAARDRVEIYRRRVVKPVAAAALGGGAAAAVERRAGILEAADRSYEQTLQRIKASKDPADVLLVLQALRTLQDINLEYNRALSEAWQAASEIAGLLQEEDWPPTVAGAGKVK